MFKNKTQSPANALQISEEALGHVVGGVQGAEGAQAEPVPAKPAKKCKPGEPSCTDATKPYGDWGS